MLTKWQWEGSVFDRFEEEVAAEFGIDVHADDSVVLLYTVIKAADMQGADLGQEQCIIVPFVPALERPDITERLEDIEIAEIVFAEDIQAEAFEVPVESAGHLCDFALEDTLEREGHRPILILLVSDVITVLQAISVS